MSALSECQLARTQLEASQWWSRSKGTGNHLDLCHTHIVNAINLLSTPPPPPPAGSTRIGNGLLLNAQGNTFGTFTAAQLDVFGGIISGSDKASNFKTLEAGSAVPHGFLYHTVYECGGSVVWPGCVLASWAEANGAVYRDSTGAVIHDPAQGFDVGNVGTATYQSQWQTNVKPQLAAGCNRLFLDNCDGNIWWGKAPVANGVTLTDSDIATELAAFLSALKQATGAYLLCNVGQGYPDRLSWIERILPTVDGIALESFDGSAWFASAIGAIQSAGRDPWCFMPTGVKGGDALARQYATAFAGMWDRKGGGLGLANPEPANVNWTQPITG